MKNSFQLTSWQKKQAALLYHFSSLDYLIKMQSLLINAVNYTENILDLSKVQDRDKFLTDVQWGARDTSENWANNAWPLLKDFQVTTARQVAERSMEKFNLTGSNQFSRGIAEYSMSWTSPEEENTLKDLLKNISDCARYIDLTLDKYSTSSRWDDFNFIKAWDRFKGEFPAIPRLRVREDILVDTNKIPPRTGVYVSADDPNAALQFSWTGGTQGKILPGKTFNYLGNSALSFVGRQDLWIDGEKMLQFVLANKNDSLLKADAFYADSKTAVLAPSLVARNAFTSVQCKWFYVELISGEFEEIVTSENMIDFTTARVSGGEKCPMSGYYFTPARANSRKLFSLGEVMPSYDSQYGLTIWQWDNQQ